MSHPDADIARTMRILRIIGIALASGLLVLSAVAALMIVDGGLVPDPVLPTDLLPWAAGAGALVLVAAPWLGGKVADSAGPTRASRVQSYLSGRILTASLQDGVGLVGLLLGLLTGSLGWALAFAAAAAVALLTTLPREDDLRRRLESARDGA